MTKSYDLSEDVMKDIETANELLTVAYEQNTTFITEPFPTEKIKNCIDLFWQWQDFRSGKIKIAPQEVYLPHMDDEFWKLIREIAIAVANNKIKTLLTEFYEKVYPNVDPDEDSPDMMNYHDLVEWWFDNEAINLESSVIFLPILSKNNIDFFDSPVISKDDLWELYSTMVYRKRLLVTQERQKRHEKQRRQGR